MKAERALAKAIREQEKWARAYSREIGEMDYWSGLESARVEGIAEAKFEIARKMKARGYPLEEIVEDTGLTQELIEKLQQSNEK
jgi:predicted transposase/invertase (TIGR01784 family)